jgi:membrane protein DedA with SNARE-associated domain
VRELALTLQSWGPGGAFLLAVLDSAGIPLPAGVDALIVLVAATNPNLAWITAAITVAGSAIGCMVLFSLARKGGQLYLDLHSISPRASRFRASFSRYGLVTVFIPGLVPIPMPLKVFVLSAGALGVPPRSFLAVVLASRIPRYFGLAFLGKQLGDNSVHWLKAHVWHMAGFSLLLFAALFLLVRIAGRTRVE